MRIFQIIFLGCLVPFTSLQAESEWLEDGQQAPFRIGILCSDMGQAQVLVEQMSGPVETLVIANRPYCYGNLWGIDTVIGTHRVGKVAAAISTVHLISLGQIQVLLSLGEAGTLDPHVSLNDIAVPETLIQYDMDGRPLFRHHYVPFLETDKFEPDPTLLNLVSEGVQTYLSELPESERGEMVDSLLASGDSFVHQAHQRMDLIEEFVEGLTVDMESGAIAQTCQEHNIPYAALRFICHRCDDSAVADYFSFVRDKTCRITPEVLMYIYNALWAALNPDMEMETSES